MRGVRGWLFYNPQYYIPATFYEREREKERERERERERAQEKSLYLDLNIRSVEAKGTIPHNNLSLIHI